MERETEQKEKIRRAQTLGVAISWAFYLLTWMAGCLSFGVALWIVVERNFYTNIFGSSLLEAAAYMQTVSGGMAIVFSIIGCIGGACKSRIVIQIHFVAILLASAGLLTSAFVAIAYKVKIDQNPENSKNHMRNVIRYSYGVNLENSYNYRVTESWDATQSKLWCCAVDDESWTIYRESQWLQTQQGLLDYDKPLVPESCCVTDQYGSYISLQKCQTWPNGPPTKAGETNECLFYRGCYGAIREFSIEHSNYLIGIGISTGLALALWAALAMHFQPNNAQCRPRYTSHHGIESNKPSLKPHRPNCKIPDLLVSLWLFLVIIPKGSNVKPLKGKFPGLYK